MMSNLTTSIRRMVACWTVCAILLSWVSLMQWLSTAQAASLRGQDVQPQTQQLSALLNADGSLNIASGFSGSVDATGYTMHTDAAGVPHFAPAAPQAAGDERWSTGFGLPGIKQARITAMAVAANGDVYVGGTFTRISTVEASHIARWDG